MWSGIPPSSNLTNPQERSSLVHVLPAVHLELHNGMSLGHVFTPWIILKGRSFYSHHTSIDGKEGLSKWQGCCSREN